MITFCYMYDITSKPSEAYVNESVALRQTTVRAGEPTLPICDREFALATLFRNWLNSIEVGRRYVYAMSIAARNSVSQVTR